MEDILLWKKREEFKLFKRWIYHVEDIFVMEKSPFFLIFGSTKRFSWFNIQYSERHTAPPGSLITFVLEQF